MLLYDCIAFMFSGEVNPEKLRQRGLAMSFGEERERKAGRISYFTEQLGRRSWRLEFKDRRPEGVEDEIAKVQSPDSGLRICFHLTGGFLTNEDSGWEQKIAQAVGKAESLFVENRDCQETVKLMLRSGEPFLMEPPLPCKQA